MSDDRTELLKQMPEIAKAVNAFTSPEVQVRAFELLVGDAGSSADSGTAPIEPEPAARKVAAKKTAVKKAAKQASTKRSSAGAPKVDKGLNLRPPGTVSWRDFVAEKKPGTQSALSMCAVYWLSAIAEIEPVSVDAVYTCFRDDGRKQPTNFRNHLQVLASRDGYLDTADMANIHLTANGSNFVEHDLPASQK